MPFRIVFTGCRTAALQEVDVRRPGSGEVALRSLVSLISTGTEVTAFRRAFDPNTHWDSWVKYPFQPGYATVAQVERLGENAPGVNVGQRVVVRIPHTSHLVVNVDQITPVPEEMQDQDAVWFALAKIAFVGMTAANLRLGTKLAIVGAGPLGQMFTRWAAAFPLAEIIVIDRSQKRLDLARLGGATGIIAGSLDQNYDAVWEALRGHRPDTVIDCTGNPSVLSQALHLVADNGKVVILGDTGFPTLQRITSDVVLRGVTVVGAHDAHNLGQSRSDSEREIFRLFFRLACTGRFPLQGLITHKFDPRHAQEAYSLAEENKGVTGGILFEWNEAK